MIVSRDHAFARLSTGPPPLGSANAHFSPQAPIRPTTQTRKLPLLTARVLFALPFVPAKRPLLTTRASELTIRAHFPPQETACFPGRHPRADAKSPSRHDRRADPSHQPRRASRNGLTFFTCGLRASLVKSHPSLPAAALSLRGESDSASLLSPGVPLLSRSYTAT
jgi:hypothetical protein